MGKTVVQITAVEMLINGYLQMLPSKLGWPGEIIVIDPDEGFKMVFCAADAIG
jgi:hypothetical protein